jgi:hypothetical protein
LTPATTPADLLSLICRLARREVLDEGLLGPVRVCRFRDCGRFFVRRGFFAKRGGRGKFCSTRCKSRFHMTREERRDYMRRYRKRKRLAIARGRL